MGSRPAGHPAWVRVSDPITRPKGLLCWVDFKPGKAFEPMLTDLADGLTRRGITGTLKPAPGQWPTKLNRHWTALGAAVVRHREPADTYRTRRDAGEWLPDDPATRAVFAAAIDWLLAMEGDLWISAATASTRVDPNPEQLLDFAVTSLGHSWSGFLYLVCADAHDRIRRISVDRWGLLTIREHHPTADRTETLAGLAAFLDEVKDHICVGLVREGTTGIDTWTHIFRSPPSAPSVPPKTHHWWRYLHLLPDHVMDAYVHQILTDSQLAKTNLHPDRWTVTDLGNGRHAVTATDPGPWLDKSDHTLPIRQTEVKGSAIPREKWQPRIDNPPTGIDPDVLAQARTDFGDAIITTELLEQNPPPELTHRPLLNPDGTPRGG